MRFRLLSLSLALLPLALSAQNSVWNERIDSSLIEARHLRPELTVIPIRPADLLRTASPLGEADPVKFIQTLPGVSTGMEGSSAYYVRGGNEANNLTTLDGIPVYGAGHLLGLTISYPSEIVSKTDFHAGGFPSESGGYTASLLQLTTQDGDFRKAHGSVFVNNFLTGGHASVPLKKDRLSLLASARISPMGPEYSLLRPHLEDGLSLPDRLDAWVGDVFSKITWKPGARDRVFLSVFGSYDQYDYEREESSSQALGWSNLIANLTWFHEGHSGWKWKHRLSHNGFRAFQNQSYRATRMSLQSALMEEGLSIKAFKHVTAALDVHTGGDLYLSIFHPGVTKVYLDNKLSATSGQPFITARSSVFGQVDYGAGPFHTSSGVRVTVFFSDGYTTVKPIANLLVSFALSPSFTAKATFDHTVQFFHSLEGIPTGWSMEMLIPSTLENRPETADQAWAGLEYAHGPVSFSVGGFYKRMKDLVFYADASSFFSTAWKDWRKNLESGDGHSYGLEVLSRVDSPRFSSQLSYTLSKTDRVFSSLNFGHPFPFKFDRRHMLNLTGELKLTKGHSVTAGLSFMSGHWETVASGSYPVYSLGSEDKRESHMAEYTSHPNNFQLPAYFRMDVGYHVTWQSGKNKHDLSIGIYNLTNRHNAYSLSWDSTEGRWKQLSIFPILPNFTYRITIGN